MTKHRESSRTELPSVVKQTRSMEHERAGASLSIFSSNGKLANLPQCSWRNKVSTNFSGEVCLWRKTKRKSLVPNYTRLL